MSNHVEWANACAGVSLVDPDFADPYGTTVDQGNIGVWISETVLVEGTVEEFEAMAESLLTVIGSRKRPITAIHRSGSDA